MLKRGAGPAEPFGAKPMAVEIEPKRLKEMLTYPESWGPSEWGEQGACFAGLLAALAGGEGCLQPARLGCASRGEHDWSKRPWRGQ